MSDLFKHPSLLWGRKRNSAPNNSTTHFFVVVKLSTFCVRLIWIVLILLRKFVQLPLFYTQRKKIIRIGSAIRKTMCKNYYDYCIQFLKNSWLCFFSLTLVFIYLTHIYINAEKITIQIGRVS